MTQELTADYVIIGAGAVAMAFADTILHESDATMIIIDRYAKPGGHWNVAYQFVTLHQPSSFYGVSSKELSGGRKEKGGWNDGLAELATGADVSAYFDDIMRHDFLPSGRVQYFPMSDYKGDGQFVSNASGKTYSVTAKKKLVDCTWLNTSVPATHTPNFEVAEGVNFMPVNGLISLNQPPEGYVIIGGGKTAIDAILWLLENRVDPDSIKWVVNRDAWLLDRRNTQMGEEFFFDTFLTDAKRNEAIASSQSPADMFHKLEACGFFLRLDPNIEPQMFHGATVTKMELEQLRSVKNVIRQGYVTKITPNEIVLERGTVETAPGTIHVDCAAGVRKMDVNRPHPPIFDGNVITPQMTRPYQPVFSASLVAHTELTYETDDAKNNICGVVPGPDTLEDFIQLSLASLRNEAVWAEDSALQEWMAGNRLEAATAHILAIPPEATDKWEVLGRIMQARPEAARKLEKFAQEMNR